jgi:hypothetical protein
MVAYASNQRGKELRPEDKMATDSQNGDIITLSLLWVLVILCYMVDLLTHFLG